MPKAPRKLSLVTLKEKWASEPSLKSAPFFKEQPLVYLGEIPNMLEHGVFVGHKSGQMFIGLHISQFRELKSEEV